MQYMFHAQPMITYGEGCSALIGQMVQKAGVPANAIVMLVHGKNVKASGLVDNIEHSLRAAGYILANFDKVVSDAPVEIIREGAAFAQTHKISAIVALGGGSCLDIAKAIAVMLSNEGDILNFVGMDAVPNRRNVVLATIPTTCGTGSEVTDGGVVYDTETNRKISFWDGYAAPDIALLDPALLTKLPLQLVAQTALDALAHSLEAYTSVAASPISDALALGAIQMIVAYLPKAYTEEPQVDDLGMLLTASTMAGMSFNRSSVHFGHSIAHAVGALAHIHHGAACALAMPLIVREESRALPEKMATVAKIFGAADMDGLTPEQIGDCVSERIRSFNESFGIKRWGQYGVTEDQIITALQYIEQDPITQMSAQQIAPEAIAAFLKEGL